MCGGLQWAIFISHPFLAANTFKIEVIDHNTLTLGCSVTSLQLRKEGKTRPVVAKPTLYLAVNFKTSPRCARNRTVCRIEADGGSKKPVYAVHKVRFLPKNDKNSDLFTNTTHLPHSKRKSCAQFFGLSHHPS